VTYDKAHEGMIDLQLVGGDAAACASASVRKSSASIATVRKAKKTTVINSLWSSDNHGRYSTQGNNSVATVMGTQWLTQNLCDGTLTRVARGKVRVRDTHTGRTVIVTAGHSYVAK
jgi:hypothetical protein